MSFEIYIIGAAMFVGGLVFGFTIARDSLNKDESQKEFLHCFMRDLKAGMYKRK